MKPSTLSRIGPIALVAGLLGSLAVGAPVYNAQNAVPRSVFLTLPKNLPEPQVAISASQDHGGRWILRIEASAFQFTELCLPDAEAMPIGHAHVILDGVKVASAYHPIVDLGVLPPGKHRIAVILRGQDHRALLGQNGLIRQEMMIEIL